MALTWYILAVLDTQVPGRCNYFGGKYGMDDKTKKLIFVIVATMISLISAVVGVVLNIDTNLVKDAVNFDIGVCEEM